MVKGIMRKQSSLNPQATGIRPGKTFREKTQRLRMARVSLPEIYGGQSLRWKVRGRMLLLKGKLKNLVPYRFRR